MRSIEAATALVMGELGRLAHRGLVVVACAVAIVLSDAAQARE